MPRNLPPRIQNHITRARRMRIIGGTLLVTCLLIGTGAALTQTQLLAASATSFPQSIAEKVRNLFCRWLGCESDTVLAQQPPQPSIQQRATLPQNVRQAETSPPQVRSATTSNVVSNAPASNSAPESPASIRSPASSGPVTQIPVIERTNTIIQTGLTEALLDARLAALQSSLEQRMAAMNNANATSFQSVSPASNPTSVNASTITGTITNAIDIATAAIASLTATELVATNATTTSLYVSGTATIGSGTGLLQADTGVVSTLANGSNGQVLKIVGGALSWSSDLTGGGGGTSAWATTTDDLALYPADTSDVVLIGASATTTTGNIFEVNGSALFRNSLVAYGLLTAPRFTATSSVASILPYASTTAITATTASTTNLYVSGTPVSLLKTNASGQVAAAVAGSDYLDAATTLFSTTSANFWQTTRNFFATTSADYWESQQTARTADDLTNNSIEDLQDVAAITEDYGDLSYWNGAAWADIATSSLAINTSNLVEGSNLFFTDARVQSFIHSSSTIPKTYTANTFTGLQTFTNASTSILSATTLCLSTDCRTSWPAGGSSFDYLFPGNATSTTLTFNSGLLSVGSATIAGNATTTGMLGVGSIFIGNSRFTSLLGAGLLNTSGALTLDTSGGWIGTFDGLEGSTYLANAFSTTSADVWKANRNFFASTSTHYWKSVTDLFSTTSAQYFAHSSTTIPKTYGSNVWTGANTFSALSLGSLNGPLHANAGVLSATTSIGVLYGGTGLTTAPTYGQILVGNSSSGYTLTATSSLGISGSSSQWTTSGTDIYYSTGNVGIGTTSPGYPLDVTGDINFTGRLREDGNEIFASMIAPFAGSCPTGWSEYTAARGRAVVGTPSGGTNAGTVGSALGNLGTRTVTDVASHLHTVDPPSTNTNTTGAHTHTYTLLSNGGFSTGYDGTGGSSADNTSSAGDHSHSVDIAQFNSGTTGVASVDVTMPYIQLTYCQKAAGADIAEWIPASEDIGKATIVSVDPENREKVIASRTAYDNSVVGVVATQPGWLLGQEAKDSVQMALAGRVPMRVSLKNGEIKIGDPITTSSIPGVGMKAMKAGPTVGKAMEAVNETSAVTSCTDPMTGRTEKCTTALVFVNISWYSPTLNESADSTLRFASAYTEPLSIGADFETGDIVALEYRYPQKQGDSGQTEKTGYLMPASTQGYAVGVISTEIAGPGNLLRRKRENNRIVEELHIIESGKAELNISPSSDPIQVGDPIAVSPDEAGRGTKAETAGFIVARALEAWEPDKGKGAISVMIDSSWWAPALPQQPVGHEHDSAEFLEHFFDDANTDGHGSLGFLQHLFAHLIDWLADAANGITNIVTELLTAKRVQTDELCVGQVCITESQFMTVFSASAAAALPESVTPPASNIGEPEPPISVTSTSTPEAAASTPEASAPEPEVEELQTEVTSADATPDAANDNDAAPADQPDIEPANDNQPANDNALPLSATGTE